MKILVSSCLLGEKVRYDGQSKAVDRIEELSRYYELIPFCPEVSGGLSVPREAAEIKGSAIDILENKSDSSVQTSSGTDVTAEFLTGAGIVLNICKEQGITLAILKSKSPSCGTGTVYDGTFSRTLTEGFGVTAQLLRDNDIEVMDESRIEELLSSCEG